MTNIELNIVECFGDNSLGQVDVSKSLLTLHIEPETLSTGDGHVCVDHSKDEIVLIDCWGSDSHGQSNIPTYIVERVMMIKTRFWSGLSAGVAHTCLIDDLKSTVMCWGVGYSPTGGNSGVQEVKMAQVLLPRVLSAG